MLALLLAVCMILSPLGTAAVRADEGTEQSTAAAEEQTEEKAAAEEAGTETGAQGESAADETAAEPAEKATETESSDAAEPEAGAEGSEESEAVEVSPAEEAPAEAEPAKVPENTESLEEKPAEETTEKPEETAVTEEPAEIPEEEAPAEEVPAEEEPEEEYAEVQWPEDDGYVYQGGLLSMQSTALKPKPILSRKVVTLRSAINKEYVLDVKSAGVANATVVHLYKENGTDAQKFILQENSDGTVTFLSYMCGKALDIKANSSANGAQVQIYASNGTSAQKFKMIKNSDGTVTLKHSTNGKVIDISGAKAVNGRKVQLYTSNGTKAQKFYLDQKTEYYFDYSDNDWLIRSRINSASVLNVASSSKSNAGNVNLYATTRAKNQRFTIEPVGGYYKIINVNSGKALDVKSAKSANGTNIQQYTWNATKAQLWKIQLNTDGSVTLVSAVNNTKVIDISGAKTANGTNAQLYTSNGTNAQKFFLVNADLDWDAVNTKNTGKKVSTSSENQIVLSKIIGAVESGGQNYESGLNYTAYAPPYNSTSKEYTITLGWAQHYGEDAKTLLQMIRDRMNKNKANSFHEYDKGGQLEAMLKDNVNWLTYENPHVINSRYADGRKSGWDPSQYEFYELKDGKKIIQKENGKTLTLKDLIIKLINTKIGRDCQDELFFNNMRSSVEYCEKTYTTDVRAVMMYCQIRHLGGASAAKRVFDRLNGVYSVDSIMASLALDRLDTSSSNQVGDDKFWSRHEKCKEFVQKYAIP